SLVFVEEVGRGYENVSFPVYRDLRTRNATFEDLIAYRIAMMDVDPDRQPVRAWGYLATGNYFDVLGGEPARGGLFHAEADPQAGANPVAVLSFDYWQRQFAGNPAIVGRTLRINRLAYTVIGVAARGFDGTEMMYRPDVWVPMTMQA